MPVNMCSVRGGRKKRDIEACCDGSRGKSESLISQRILRVDKEEIIILRGLLLVTAKMDDDKESDFKGK